MATEPTAAAMRVSKSIFGQFQGQSNVQEAIEIDRLTGLPELIAALQWYVDNDDTDETADNDFWLVGKSNAINALLIAREGRK